MREASSSSFVLLVKWSSGATEQLEIPAGGRLTIGPVGESMTGPFPLYEPNRPVTIGSVMVRGCEVPSMLVAPAPAVVPAEAEEPPEWYTELVAELQRRHALTTPDGCEGAMTEAARLSDSFGFRCRSCASLARGYRSAGGALAAIKEEDREGWARHSEAASRHFREAVELARQGEEVGA